MGSYEIECDVCLAYGESNKPFKTVCIHCFNKIIKENKKLKKKLEKLVNLKGEKDGL